MTWTQKELEALYQEVVKKSAVDAGFRKELLDDSVAAMEKVAGKPLPEGFKLKFIERDPSYAATYVLPDFASDELDMKQLQAVSGGSGGDVQASDTDAIQVIVCPADVHFLSCAVAMCATDMGSADICAANAECQAFSSGMDA